MNQNFEINSNQIDKIKKITSRQKEFRIKNLELFKAAGFPNKKFEDWKFSDFNEIVRKNFDYLETSEIKSEINKINLIKDFKHNFIIVVNGKLNSSNFDHEVKNFRQVCPKEMLDKLPNPLTLKPKILKAV